MIWILEAILSHMNAARAVAVTTWRHASLAASRAYDRFARRLRFGETPAPGHAAERWAVGRGCAIDGKGPPRGCAEMAMSWPAPGWSVLKRRISGRRLGFGTTIATSLGEDRKLACRSATRSPAAASRERGRRAACRPPRSSGVSVGKKMVGACDRKVDADRAQPRARRARVTWSATRLGSLNSGSVSRPAPTR